MRKNRFIFLMAVILSTAFLFSGCFIAGDSGLSPNSDGSSNDNSETVGFQLDAPAAGEKIAVVHTDMGDISIRFFPEIAPKAVENFITHSENGYYDGITFHRTMDNFMIQGGDPTGTGSGGKSIWNKAFNDEFSDKLFNLRGSLSMANAGVNTNGSQFFINQAKPSNANSYPSSMPAAVQGLYNKYGGNYHLDGAWRPTGGHTVFGQVFDGMDVVDAIASAPVKGERPVTPVVINSIEIKTY